METIPSTELFSIANKVKTSGGKVYYTYNPGLFTINMNDVALLGDSATYSFSTSQISSTNSVMFPGEPITGLTPSLLNNPILLASGLTTSFWQLDLPRSIQKVGANYELKYGQNTVVKTILATGPGGSDSHLLPFLPGGIYDGYSPRGLIYLNGAVVNKGPKSDGSLAEFRSFFKNLRYDSKDWILTTSAATASGTTSGTTSVPTFKDYGITFSFTHNGLGSTLLPFSYTSLSDDLIKSGAYVYNLAETAEFNRERAGGTASGWPSLIQQPPALSTVTASGTASGLTPSGQTPSAPTQSWTIRYLELPNLNLSNDVGLNPQLTLQIFAYDIENEVGKSANPAKTSTVIPKIRGQFVFDVRYQGLLLNDQLGEFKILEKVEIDPYIATEPDNLEALDPSFLEESFAGEEETLDDDRPSDDLKTFLGEFYTEEEAQLEQQATQQVQQTTTTGTSVPAPSGPEQTIQIEGKIQVSRADADSFWGQLSGYNGVKEVGNNAGDPVTRFLKDVGLNAGQPWCMAFVYSMFKEFTSKKGVKNPLTKTGGTKYFWSQTPSQHKILASAAAANTSLIKGGQIFIKSRDGGGHTGIVLKVDGPNHFLSIDGNSSDKVRLNRYTISSMIGFIDYFSNPYFSDRVSELATPLLTSSNIAKGGGKET